MHAYTLILIILEQKILNDSTQIHWQGNCRVPFRFSRLDKSQVSAIMKTKGDTVTCSQAPDLIANMLYQLTIRLPSSGQHAFVESASSKIAASRRTCNAFFHICTTSLRMKCAGIGGLTTEVTVSRMGHYIILRRTLSMLSKPPRRVSHTLAGWSFHGILIILYGMPRLGSFRSHSRTRRSRRGP